MNEFSPLIGAVDLGGTKIYCAILDADDRIIASDLRSTEAQEGRDAVVSRIGASLTAAAASAGTGVAALAGVGIAAPGPVDHASGHVIDPPNLEGWQDAPLGPMLAQRLAVRVLVENDANAAALGEYAAGSGKGARALIFVTVSTGIGGGIVLGGELYRGAGGATGEIGHMVVEPNGPRCGCGRLGCLEAVASGTAIARDGSVAIQAGRASILQRLRDHLDQPVDAETVAQAAALGDPDAAQIIRQAGERLGVGLGNLVNILNPDVIVIGGGVAKIGEAILDPARQSMRRTIFARAARHIELRGASLDYAAIVGMAALLRRQ